MDSIKQKIAKSNFCFLKKLKKEQESELDGQEKELKEQEKELKEQESELDEREKETKTYTRRDFKTKHLNNNQYVEALNYYIENDVECIGIMGDYSSGKSSIINTYKSKTDNEVITLSTATFSQKNYSKENNEKHLSDDSAINNDPEAEGEELEQVTLEEDKKIEIEIIKVFIHHLHNMLEDNTYISTKLSIKKNMSNKKLRVISMLIVLSILLITRSDMIIQIIVYLIIEYLRILIKIINFLHLDSIYNVIILNSMRIYDFMLITKIIVQISIMGVVSYTLFILIEYVLKYMQISKVDKNGISLSPSDSLTKNNEIIEREMHILVELFKEIYNLRGCDNSKSLIVVFEDIDRFNNEGIFDFLYRLAQNLKYTNMNIKFIFAIRPDMIKGDVTKYFDAVIDVIPHYHILNAASIFEEEAEAQIGKLNLSKALLNNTIPHVKNARDTKRLINYLSDLHLLQKKLNSEKSDIDSSIINSNRLYAIALLNVLYPNELSLTSEVGEVTNSTTQEIIKIIEMVSRSNEIPFGKAYKYICEKSDINQESSEKQIVTTEDTKKYNKLIDQMDPRKKKILEYLFLNNYLDGEYRMLLSPNSIKYDLSDQQFVLNLINRRGIFDNGNTDLKNPQLIIDELVEAGSLESYRELINISILKHYINIKQFENVDKLITNMERNDSIPILTEQKDIDNIMEKIISKIKEYNAKVILENLTIEKIESFSDKTIIEAIDVILEYKLYDEQKTSKIFSLFSEITFNTKELFAENIEKLSSFAESLNESVVLTKEKYNVIKSIGKLESKISPILFTIEPDIIEEVLEDEIIPKKYVYLFMCEENPKLDLMELSIKKFENLVLFIDEELVSDQKIDILNTIFSKEYRYSFAHLNSFTYAEILDLLKRDKVNFKNEDILSFTKEVALEKAGNLCFEDIVYDLKEKYILNLVENSSEEAKQIVTEYVLFNKIGKESDLYTKLISDKYSLDEKRLRDYENIPEHLLRLFKFDFTVFKEYYYMDKTKALIYARNYEVQSNVTIILEDVNIFIDLLTDQRLESLLLHCVDNLSFSNIHNLSNFVSVSAKVMKKLISSPSKGIHYKIDFNSLVEWINMTNHSLNEIKPIIKYACIYQTGDDNSIIKANIKWSNSYIFEFVYENIKNKFKSTSENIEFLSTNIKNISNLSKLIENSETKEYFDEFYKFLSSDKSKMRIVDKFKKSDSIDILLEKLCTEHNIKKTNKELRKKKK